MGKLKSIINENIGKLSIIVIALVAVISIFVINDKITSNKTAQTTENYSLANAEAASAETTVQTGTVTVYYLDEQGNAIKNKQGQSIEPTVKTGNVGTAYDIERPSFAGYTRAGEEPLTRAGKYQLGNVNVKFIYKKADSTVYKDVTNEGVKGASKTSATITFRDPKTARDYSLKVVTKDEKGNPIDGGEFKVKRGDEILSQGKVTGGEFYAGKIGITHTGKIVYEVEQTKSTIGYKKLDEIVDLGLTSTWNETEKKFEISVDEITNENVEVSLDGDIIILEVTNPKYKNMYEVEIVNKTKTELVTGGKFKVDKNNETIINDYVKNGKLYVGGFELSEDKTDRYTVYETETAEGYYKVIEDNNPGIVTVTTKFNENTNKYDVTVKTNGIPGFTAEVKNGKVTVYVETEKIKNKYDLAIKKFVSDVDGIEKIEREPKVEIVEVKKDNKTNKKVDYKQNNDMEKVANEQKVTYTLRTYNESEVTGKGQRIIELIPDGLVFLPENETNKEYGWKTYKQDKDGDLIETQESEEITAVATDYLVDKEIEGFDIEKELPKYLDAKVVFEVDESKITSKDRIVENTVKLQPNEDDENDDNDSTTEKVYVKYFDLDITKYIKEVTVKNNVKETKQEIGENQKGKLVKIDVHKNEVNNTTIRVTYGLRVKNIGEIEGYATELVDYIPKDFKLVEDGNWIVKDGKAVSTKLQNTLLKPGESTVIEITFDWKLNENNIGRRINEGKITKYENPYNAKDPTEDNNDKEEMLVQIRTGGIWVFIVVASLAGLWTLLGTTYIIKRRREKMAEEEI